MSQITMFRYSRVGAHWLAFYMVALALALTHWIGEVSQLRVDPILYGDGNAIGVDSIVLTP